MHIGPTDRIEHRSRPFAIGDVHDALDQVLFVGCNDMVGAQGSQVKLVNAVYF